jgi:hypothetical protein
MELKNIENNIWNNIEITLSLIQNPINQNNQYLIHYAIINSNLDIVNKILTIDPDNILFVKKDVFINIAKLGKFNFILNLLDFVNDKTKIHILDNIQINEGDFIIFYFLFYSDNECIEKLLKYNKYINWNTIVDGNYCLKIFLLKHYANISENTYAIFENIIKYTDLQKLADKSYSIIIDGCLTGFNKRILDKIIKVFPDCLNLNNSKQLSPLIAAINVQNNELIDYLLLNGSNYNYNTYTNPLITAAIKNDNITIKKLLSFNDLDMNYFDANKWQVSHHIFNKTIINTELKRDILLKTNNLNIQNTNGNTVIHLMLLNDNWRDYSDILENKVIDIYCKNKLNLTPLDYLLINLKNTNNINNYEIEIDNLLEIIASSFLENINNLTISGKRINTKRITKKNKLYDLTLQCLKKETSKCIGNIRNKIEQLEISTIKIDETKDKINFINGDKTDYNLFISRDVDYYIYLFYFLKKYKIGILPPDYLKIVSSKPEIKKIINFYVNISDKYANLKSLSIIWHDKNNNAFPNNLKNLSNIKNDIIFLFVTIINPEVDHANCIIIDKNYKRIIHFEPYGRVNKQNLKDLDNKCIKIFNDIFPNFKYYSPDDYMTQNSFQMLSNEANPLEIKTGDIGGFCLAWTLWFFELYLRNSKVELSVLVDKSISKIINSKYSFMEYIRFYANKLRRFHINFLKKIKYPAEKIFNIHTTSNEKDYIYNAINNNIHKYF